MNVDNDDVDQCRLFLIVRLMNVDIVKNIDSFISTILPLVNVPSFQKGAIVQCVPKYVLLILYHKSKKNH